MYIVFIIAAIIALIIYLRIRKIPKFGNMVLVTGGVKTGKSMLSVWLAVRQFQRQKRKYYFYNYFWFYVQKFLCRLFRMKRFANKKKMEKPLLYSNIPLAVDGFTPLTLDLIQRKERFRYGSVIYVCESSLVADSMSFKDNLLNENMLLLNKLIAHETRGGYIFYDTQSINDNHFAVKRTLSTYFFIHHMRKHFPFYCAAWVRELKYSDDNSSVNTFNEDVEETLKLVLIPKKVWCMYDRYCYSVLTDHLPVNDKSVYVDRFGDKKARKIISFKRYLTVQEDIIQNEESKVSETQKED